MKVKQLSKRSFAGLVNSQLVLECSETTAIMMNTLRRTMLQYVPTYAFANEGIKIDTSGKSHTRVFDNDYMRLRLSQLTLQNLDGENLNKELPDYLPEKYWDNVDYKDPKREKHPNDTVLYEVFINASNKQETVLNVTTNTENCTVYKDGEVIKNPFGKIDPILLIQLRKDEEFKCRMVAMLGVGFVNNIWTPVSNIFYDEISDNVFKFTIESNGQLDEYTILIKACRVMKTKFKQIKEIILSQTQESVIDKKIMILKLKENHTFGGVLNDYIQNNKNISFSGMTKPDMLVNEIIIKVMSATDESPSKYIIETVDLLLNDIDAIEKMFAKLSKK